MVVAQITFSTKQLRMTINRLYCHMVVLVAFLSTYKVDFQQCYIKKQ